MTTFAAKVPFLFHVTEGSALHAISQDGLLSACDLCARYGLAGSQLLTANRTAWYPVGPHVLRRQGMSDYALRPRLDPAIPLEDWRAFINRFVFLYPRLAASRRFLGAEPTRDQVILRFDTRALLAAAALRTCAFNNGYVDRAPRAVARQRRFDDYIPVEAWTSDIPVKEVVAAHVPPGIDFEVLPPA